MSETNINVGRHWVIFNPKAETPTRMHKTYDSAETEARRLAEKNIGDEFIIYESVASACLQAQVNRPAPF